MSEAGGSVAAESGYRRWGNAHAGFRMDLGGDGSMEGSYGSCRRWLDGESTAASCLMEDRDDRSTKVLRVETEGEDARPSQS